MLLYQDLREKEEEKEQEEIRLEALKTKKERLEIRQKELDKRYKEAGERCRIAENNDYFPVELGKASRHWSGRSKNSMKEKKNRRMGWLFL